MDHGSLPGSFGGITRGQPRKNKGNDSSDQPKDQIHKMSFKRQEEIWTTSMTIDMPPSSTNPQCINYMRNVIKPHLNCIVILESANLTKTISDPSHQPKQIGEVLYTADQQSR